MLLKERGTQRRVQRLVSAGGVVYRVVDGKIETVLCGRLEPLRWSLPKGTPDEGETLEQTALREVREETGLDAAIEAPIGNINYWFVAPNDRSQCNKTVHFYLMAHMGGSTDRHDPEFDEVMWFSSEDALRSLAHANEARVMEKALAMIKERTPL
jgi:8-oxo-dGTP pyrophosphatase MutT (NUDIX family)